MAYSHRTRSMYKFPITVEVRNDTKKGHGLLPLHVAAEYRLLIGRSPTISTLAGQIYGVRFVMNLNEGVFSNGWSDFVEAFNLEDCDKVTLKYHGDSFFTFDEKDQQGYPRCLKHHKRIKIEEHEKEYEEENIFGQIRLMAYSISNNHQNLPSSFVISGLNLRLRHVLLEVDEGTIWYLGLYFNELRPKEARLSSGWKLFCSELQLKPGDHIFLKVHDRSKNHLLAHIERM